ncbi:DUF2793 domain-containing protein [Candidatus Phycosocius spiralis]|nr:DUF2793 domain-containing protein [Candidatus Phycosocius spiralis]
MEWLVASQADKHVTLNSALKKIDTLLGACVLSRRSSPPANSTENGDCFLLNAAGTGAWNGFPIGSIATFDAGVWQYVICPAGTILTVVEENLVLLRLSNDWVPLRTSLGLLAIGGSDTSDWSIKAIGRGLSLQAGETGTYAGSVYASLNRLNANKSSLILHETLNGAKVRSGYVDSDTYKIELATPGGAWKEGLSIGYDGNTLKLINALILNHINDRVTLTKSDDEFFEIGPLGSYQSDRVDAFWRGLHLTPKPIVVNNVPQYPRLGFTWDVDRLTNPTNISFRMEIGNNIPGVNHSIYISASPGGRIILANPIKLNTYVQNSLPNAGFAGKGALIHIDGSPGGIAWSDGATWRWTTTNGAV